MPAQFRNLVLPASAAIILALVAYKQSLPPQPPVFDQLDDRRPAPRFAALDSQNQLVKFERYLGRHEILLVFFAGDAGADHDPMLQRARAHFKQLQRRGLIVIGVSTALPQHNRQAAARSGPFPFPLLSDPTCDVHRRWGRFDDNGERPLSGVFLIDRAGLVAWKGQAPQPESNLDELLPPLLENH